MRAIVEETDKWHSYAKERGKKPHDHHIPVFLEKFKQQWVL